MNRRGFLSAATLLAGGIGGCAERQRSGGSDGDAEPERTSAASTDTPEADRHLRAFERDLGEGDLDVRSLEVRGRVVRLSYTTPHREYGAVSSQIGRISGFYFRHVRDGWDVDRLAAEAHAADGTVFTWHAKSVWYEQYAAGEMTADELSLAVLETATRKDGE